MVVSADVVYKAGQELDENGHRSLLEETSPTRTPP